MGNEAKDERAFHTNLIKEMLRENQRFLTQYGQVQEQKLSKLNGCLLKVEKSLKKYDEALRLSQKQFEIVEETLCNVLLAIRQNEYLQAYYPESQGHPAGKYVGRHPVQERRDKK